jgi:hypothetical protein
MRKNTIITVLQKELHSVNDAIDGAIIKGVSYSHYAKRHRELLSLLHHAKEDRVLSQKKWKSFFSRKEKCSPVRRHLLLGARGRMFLSF